MFFFFILSQIFAAALSACILAIQDQMQNDEQVRQIVTACANGI
jgi:hypothetical protein